MLIKRLKECGEITAGDGTRLRELLHPQRDPAGVRYSLAVARLAPGQSSLPHRLKTSEVYYLIEGKGEMHVDNEAARVQAGDAVYIPPGATQRLSNSGPEEIAFICIVDPAWQAEDEEVMTGQDSSPEKPPGPA
jgi:mannose-6-phosphate isomerase-like protein (cupin superfamily)